MSVVRVNKTRDYTVMSNAHFKEKKMTLKAKGLLSLMLSLPDSWDYSINGLVAICVENQTAIKSTLSELKKFGYLKVTKKMPNETETGRIEYIYDIYEQPICNQGTEKQGIENLSVECLAVENPLQLSTDKSSTNISSKNETNKNYYIAVIDYLNKKAGTSYRAASKATQAHINARLSEGYTLDDFFAVIDKKCAEWLGTDMAKYLRPETLFGSKFESYLNAPLCQRKATGANGVTISTDGENDLEGIF